MRVQLKELGVLQKNVCNITKSGLVMYVHSVP